MNTPIHEQLRALRIERGITTTQLAEMVGMRHQHITRIESGAHSPRLTTLERVATALGAKIILKKKNSTPKKEK